MSNNIQDFIGKLKKIDVGNLLEKAKTVKVEDFRNIKFSDLSKIKDNKYFYPISGFLFASLEVRKSSMEGRGDEIISHYCFVLVFCFWASCLR